MMQKIAVGPALPPGVKPNPQEFPLPAARGRLAQLSPAAFQHAGVQPYNNDWTSRQVWEASQAVQNAPAARVNRRGMTPQERAEATAFNSARTWTTNMAKRHKPPVFAPPGSPAAAKHVSVLAQQANAAPQQPAPAPAPQVPAPVPAPVPQAPPPPRLPPAAGPPPPSKWPGNQPHAVPGFKVGDQIPPGHFLNDLDILQRVKPQPPLPGPVPRLPPRQ